MKKVLKFSALALAVIILGSCRKITGDGPVVSETRSTREFSAIHFSVPGELAFVPSDHYEIIVEAQRNISDVIETYVRGGELEVKVRNNVRVKAHEEIRITVKAPDVNTLSLSGSGNLTVPASLKAAHVKLRISGSGNMSLNKAECNELEIIISGSGNVEVLDGAADHEEISISGSGSVDVLGVMSKKAATHTSGSGTIRLFVEEELDTQISGSGNVFYKGSPEINLSVSGSGKVHKLD